MSTQTRRDVLVGVLPHKRDLEILLRERWYRIPIQAQTGPDWPPKWIAFYEGNAIREERGIYRYAEVRDVAVRSREELFPGEPSGSRRGKRYYQVHLGPIEERARPVTFACARRFAFIRTTMTRFRDADTVNDLFTDSPLEDKLWQAFKNREIPAERQWIIYANGSRYVLDFALFCSAGKIDVEADGDTYHITPEQAPRDNQRNNELAAFGWSVLRFETGRIENYLSECLDTVLETVERLKGFKSRKLVPSRYVRASGGVVPQLSLFEGRQQYAARD